MADLSWPFYISTAMAAYHYYWQISSMDMNDRLNLTERFVSNQYFGIIILSGIIAGKLI